MMPTYALFTTLHQFLMSLGVGFEHSICVIYITLISIYKKRNKGKKLIPASGPFFDAVAIPIITIA